MRHAKDTANETAKETATTETTTTDTTEATVGEGEMAVDYELDQIVWVRTGGNHEEPGTVLQIGGEADDGMRRRGTAAEFLSAGEYLVRLHGSAYPVAVEAAQLRSLAEATLSNTTTTTTTVVRRTSRRRAANRSVVTPSPGPDKPGATTTTEQPNGKRSPTLEDRIAIATDCSVTAPASSTDATFTTIATTGSARANQRPKRAATTATLRMPPSSKPPSPSSKRQATESAVRKRGQQKIDVDDDDASVEEEDYSVKATPPPTTAMKLVPVRNRPPPAVAAMANTENGIYDNNNNNNNEASEEEDDDDDNDRPFTIDYSPSARSTCRRCDECIGKGSLRISHVPLFRGKPGYRVYRHLECAVFAPDIVQTAHDVGGWKKLNAADYKALVVRVEESKIEIEKENEELEPDELVQTAFEGEIRGLPPNMVAGLLPFQIEGHSWMYHQEYHVPTIRGGILADEMGMGKTIQTLATILDNRPVLQHCKPDTKHLSVAPDFMARQREEGLWASCLQDWNHEMKMNNVPAKILPKKGALRAGTLVVCPLIALSQWKTEIEKFSETGSLTVGVYHGPKRASDMDAKTLQKYDIVLTTYQVLEQDFRKMVSPNKITCPNCSGKFKIDKLRIHLKYFCGAAAQRTEAQARQRRGDGRDRPPSSSQKKGKTMKKSPPMTKRMKTKSAVGTASKKKAMIQCKQLDSDDSSIELSNIDARSSKNSGVRPSRAAAQSASNKLAKSVKEWGSNFPMTKRGPVDSDMESNFSSPSEDEQDDEECSSDDEKLTSLRVGTKQVSVTSSAVKIAKQKQKEALAVAMRKSITSKVLKQTKNKKSPGNGKKFEYDSSSDEGDVDPMEGIDLDELMEEAMAGSRSSLLHSFCWWRIVLDEAHFIKSRSSQTAAAAFALTSIHRWCLSGTPLQNRVGELYSLIRFLRLDPMAHYCCRSKKCTCKSIHYRMQQGRCLDCGHASLMHYSVFNRLVLNPIQRDGYSGDGRRAMFLLRDSVLNTCLLRRTKQTRSEDMNLPPRLVTIRAVRLHPVEEDFYEALYTQTKSSFDDYVAEGTLLNNYAHIFDLLTKMRQAVDHPYLILHSKRNTVRQAGVQAAAAVANGSIDCAMCHESPTDRLLSSCCGGAFCRSCVIEYLTGAGGENTPCPGCGALFSIDLNQAAALEVVDDGILSVPLNPTDVRASNAGVPSLKQMPHVQTGSILRRINLAEFATSTKIEVLVQELIAMRRERPGSKALVFSQFVNMLDLVRWRLHSDPCIRDLGLGVRILHGGMDVKSRDASLKEFREDSNCRVLLMSLKAAGVALNLTVASECFLLDLWWNPAAELQAIDRCHRLGQHRPIRAVRFVAEGTVEERVLQLQEKKRLAFDGTIGRDAGSLKMLTVDDMKALFA